MLLICAGEFWNRTSKCELTLTESDLSPPPLWERGQGGASVSGPRPTSWNYGDSSGNFLPKMWSCPQEKTLIAGRPQLKTLFRCPGDRGTHPLTGDRSPKEGSGTQNGSQENTALGSWRRPALTPRGPHPHHPRSASKYFAFFQIRMASHHFD